MFLVLWYIDILVILKKGQKANLRKQILPMELKLNNNLDVLHLPLVLFRFARILQSFSLTEFGLIQAWCGYLFCDLEAHTADFDRSDIPLQKANNVVVFIYRRVVLGVASFNGSIKMYDAFFWPFCPTLSTSSASPKGLYFDCMPSTYGAHCAGLLFGWFPLREQIKEVRSFLRNDDSICTQTWVCDDNRTCSCLNGKSLSDLGAYHKLDSFCWWSQIASFYFSMNWTKSVNWASK